MKESMAKAVLNSSAMTTSSQNPWLLMFFLLFTTFSSNWVSSSPTQPPNYYEHCSSTVPSSTPNKAALSKFPLARTLEGYYTGGKSVLEPNPLVYSYSSTFLNSIELRTLSVYDTDVRGLFKLEGRLTFPNVNKYNEGQDYSCGRQSSYTTVKYVNTPQKSSAIFKLEGFWLESSGKLCMVGSGSTYSKEGNLVNLDAVLKLHNLGNSTSITSLITGTFESLINGTFEQISVLMLPQMEYKYTPVSGDFSNGSDNLPLPHGLSLSSLPKYEFCSIAGVNQFNLRYARDCNSAKNCSPFDAGVGYVPRIMSTSMIECSEDKERMRVLLEFPKTSYVSFYRSFNPETTLIGEGTWDETEHQLRIVACRISGVTEESWDNARVGDCSTKLSLRFPAIWSIEDASKIVGKIWTNKTVQESGYFNGIMFRSSRNDMAGVPDLKYQYTKIDTARKLCPKSEKPARTTNGERYPNPNGSSISVMRFDSYVKNSKGRIAWGNSVPIFVGALFYDYSEAAKPDFSGGGGGPVKISYRITLNLYYGISPFNASSTSSYEAVEILAEGIYDAETGSLCMVGCRNLPSDDPIPRNDSRDCEILVEFHFPSLNSKGGGYIKGSMNSTRDKSHPLYFESLYFSANFELGRVKVKPDFFK